MCWTCGTSPARLLARLHHTSHLRNKTLASAGSTLSCKGLIRCRDVYILSCSMHAFHTLSVKQCLQRLFFCSVNWSSRTLPTQHLKQEFRGQFFPCLAEPLKPSIPPTTSNVSSPRKHLKHIVGYPIPRVFPSLWLLMIWVSCLTGFWNQGQCLPEHARYGNNIVISTTSTQVTRSPRPQERVFHCVSV